MSLVDARSIMSENKESGGHTVKVERNYGIQTVELLPTSASALRFQSLHSAAIVVVGWRRSETFC